MGLFSGEPGRKAHKLGRKFLGQRRYRDAQEALQRAVEQRENKLGASHDDTIDSKYWLAYSHLQQDEEDQAEILFRQVVEVREKTFAPEHINTLNGRYWLGLSYYRSSKYCEAEAQFRHTVQGRGKTLGWEHLDTLQSQHALAKSLHKQQKYHEAVTYFRLALRGREAALGSQRVATLHTKFALALSLLRIREFDDAAIHLREARHGYAMVLGQDHYKVQQCRALLQDAVDHKQNYVILGTDIAELDGTEVMIDHKTVSMPKIDDLLPTISSTSFSLDPVHEILQHQSPQPELQQREASPPKDLPQERTLPKYVPHEDPPSDNLPPEKSPSETTLPKNSRRDSSQDVSWHSKSSESSIDCLDEFFIEKRSNLLYDDLEISRMSTLLEHANSRWSKVPRTYIVLRSIGCLHLLDALIASGFSDYWFPVTAADLPTVLGPNQISQFVDTQKIVLTKSLNLEKRANGQHCYFEQDETLPFKKQRILGRGGFSQVDEVLSLISYEKYARKQVLRSRILRGRGRTLEQLKFLVTEIELLKRLQHRHIVEFVGSYSDTKYLGLLMRPVADMDLSVYLSRPDITSYHGELRTFFGCLATALNFLHTQRVRHKDIKPENILVHCGNVLLTDFGLSLDFEDTRGSTTMSVVKGMTPRYCAPEVALQEPRGTSSDIWSLGVVFLEMFVVLKGQTVDYMEKYFLEHGTRLAYIRTNRRALIEFITTVEATGRRSDNRVLAWVSDMLQEERDSRPSASSLMTSISDLSRDEEDQAEFCGICCLPDVVDDDFSEYSNEAQERSNM